MLDSKFPSHNTSVFCWNTAKDCTKFQNSKVYAEFKLANNPAYGHDVLILLN